MPSSFAEREPDRAGAAFVGASLLVGGITAGVGLVTDLRLAVDASLAAVALIAFFPVIVIVGLLLVLVACGICFVAIAVVAAWVGDPAPALEGAALIADPAVGIIGSSDTFVPWYYRVLGRIRHPFFWAVPTGLLIGGLVMAAMLAFHVWPAEARTAATMLEIKAAIERERAASGKVPKELPGTWSDGFGRPFVYEVSGVWKMASWRLRSLGFDGKPGRDDLCMHGQSGAMSALDALARMADKLAGKQRFAAVRTLKCTE
jgi:hypothetical protein